MNPLQYLPVVGTIYRAVTGDVIPEALRDLGSMLVSGLLGGPIGLGMNIATMIGEKVTGIDPEKIFASQSKRAASAMAPPKHFPQRRRLHQPHPRLPQGRLQMLTPARLSLHGARPSLRPMASGRARTGP
jgi:hypothetical protein